jgi:hypothetical protein
LIIASNDIIFVIVQQCNSAAVLEERASRKIEGETWTPFSYCCAIALLLCRTVTHFIRAAGIISNEALAKVRKNEIAALRSQ